MNLIVSFTDQSESFTLGCEYGIIFSKIQQGFDIIDNNGFPVHIENKDVIKKTCEHFGYICVFGSEYFDTYVEFKAIKTNNLN